MKLQSEDLEASARQSAAWRGHDLTGFTYKLTPGRSQAWAKCGRLFCGMGVWIDTNPPPNGIDICGEAVALNCKGEK